MMRLLLLCTLFSGARALAVQEGLAAVAASGGTHKLIESAAEQHSSVESGSSVNAGQQQQQASQMALMNLVLDTVEAMQRLHVNSTDIKKQLEEMVKSAALVQEAYAELQAGRRLPWNEKKEQELPPIAFVRTPRTGGSSIANVLHRIADSRDLTVVLPDEGIELGELTPLHSADSTGKVQKHSYDLLCHRTMYNDARMRQYLKLSPFFFTLVRRPALQVASAFEERIQSASNFLGYSVDIDWTDRIEWLKILWHDKHVSEEVMSPSDRAQFMNPQAHALGWYDHVGGSTEFDQDTKKIDRWVDHVAKNMSFVMLTEHLDEGLVLLRRKLGLELRDVSYLFDAQMRAAARSPTPSDPEAAEIDELMQVDTKLYEHFNQTFWREWEETGGYAALGADLQEIKLWNRVLLKACEKQNAKICTRAMQAGTVDYTERLKQKRVQV